MKKKSSRRRIDVNVDELDRIIAMRAPLNETDGRTLKTAVHAMAERLVRRTVIILSDPIRFLQSSCILL